LQVLVELGIAGHVWQEKLAVIAETVDGLGDRFKPELRTGAFKMSKNKNLKRSNFSQSVFFRLQLELCGKTAGAIIGLRISEQDGMVFSSSPTRLSFVRVNPPIPTQF
jgi:hypothetical protein